MADTKLYQVGPNAFEDGDYPPSRFRWIVYWYEIGSYEGDGSAVSWDGEVLRYHTLSHCSCFGPERGMDRGDVITAEDLQSSDVLDDYRQEVADKALEIMAS